MTDTPALLGGQPLITADHTVAERWPRLDADDEQAVLAVLRDGDLSTHPVTRRLEEAYRSRWGRRHALAHANGTAALLAAFHAIGLRPGDEVIVPSATWWASAVPMLWLGAVPVFAESESAQAGLDPEDVERRCTARTRALVVVHLWGVPSRMGELRAIAARRGLRIIEDASHAHGAAWRGEPCGSLGDVSVFSLQSHKLAPAGEGGMLLTDDEACFARAAQLGDVWRCLELPPPEHRFAATTFGMKTRIAPLSAAVGLSQLGKLDHANAVRAANCAPLEDALEAIGLEPFRPEPGCTRVWFELLLRVRAECCGLDAAAFCAAMAAEGARCSPPRYPLLHQQPLFTEGRWNEIARLAPPLRTYPPQDLPRTTAMNGELVRFPLFTEPVPALVDRYAAAARRIVAHAPQIAAAVAARR
jgi:dTDP-4-amino-4,6-dideoxygalactose transaminase